MNASGEAVACFGNRFLISAKSPSVVDQFLETNEGRLSKAAGNCWVRNDNLGTTKTSPTKEIGRIVPSITSGQDEFNNSHTYVQQDSLHIGFLGVACVLKPTRTELMVRTIMKAEAFMQRISVTGND